MSVIAPYFLTLHHLTTVMKGMSLNVLPVVGLTLVMICRHIDLSVGTSLTLGGMLTIGMQPELGWAGAKNNLSQDLKDWYYASYQARGGPTKELSLEKEVQTSAKA